MNRQPFKFQSVALILLAFVMALAAFSPFFNIGFTTHDDLEYYITSQKSLSWWLYDAQCYAENQGRFYFLITKYFYYVPYLFDSFWMAKVIQIGTLLMSYLLFAYLLFRIFKSKEISALAFVFLTVFTAVTENNHIPFMAYPFFFSFSFMILICAVLLFVKYTETNKYAYVIFSAALFFVASLFYESYLLFVFFFGIYLIIRNIQKSGWSLFWRNKTFYRETVPYLFVGIVYTAIYYGYRYWLQSNNINSEFYVGATASTSLSISNLFTLLSRCTKINIPMQGYLYRSNDVAINAPFPTDFPRILAYLPAVSYVTAFIATMLVLLLIQRLNAQKFSWKKIAVVFVVSTLCAYFSHLLIGLTDKYNLEWYNWMRGYVTSYFSYFGTTTALVFIFVALLKLCRTKTAKIILSSILGVSMFAVTLIVSYSNNMLGKEWHRSQNRFRIVSLIADTDFAQSLPSHSIIDIEEMYSSLNMSDLVAKDEGLEDYFRLKWGKNNVYCNNSDAVNEARQKHSDWPVYKITKRESLYECEMLLTVSKYDTASQTAFAHVFYLSPTRLFNLAYETDTTSSACFNGATHIVSPQGRNNVIVSNPDKGCAMTYVTIAAQGLKAESISVSNILRPTNDTIISLPIEKGM